MIQNLTNCVNWTQNSRYRPDAGDDYVWALIAYLAKPNFQPLYRQYGEKNFVSVAYHLDKGASRVRRCQHFWPTHWKVHGFCCTVMKCQMSRSHLQFITDVCLALTLLVQYSTSQCVQCTTTFLKYYTIYIK